MAFIVVMARRYGLEIGLIPLDLGDNSLSESIKFAISEYITATLLIASLLTSVVVGLQA